MGRDLGRSILALLASGLAVNVAASGERASRPSPPLPIASPLPTPSLPPQPPAAAEFGEEVRLLFRVAACVESDEPLPAEIDAAVVREHCAWMRPRMGGFRRKHLAAASRYLAVIRPPGLPTSVVYPFGGGDLLSALTTYPEATEITTLSLEHAGDPRRLRSLDRKRLAQSLALLRHTVIGLLCCDNSTSENLSEMEQADLPGQVSFFLVGLALHDLEPIGLRYFRLEADGSIHYLTVEEIEASDGRMARQLHRSWLPPSSSVAFSNSELMFRPRGAVEEAPPRVHRHIAANLADPLLAKDDRILRHLTAKGQVSAMTKAASYLLWNPAFTRMRDYLLQHMAFMISDSTGIPVRFARKAGFVQQTYGRFSGPFLDASPEYGAEFARLWREQPYRPLPFRYGYPDAGKSWHLLVTRPGAGGTAEARTAGASAP